jgi:glycosyltransferase involved in cell wall biosynthesis
MLNILSRRRTLHILNVSNQIKGGGIQVAESLIQDLKHMSVLVLAPDCISVPEGVAVVRVNRNLLIRLVHVSCYLTFLSCIYRTRVLTLFGPNPSFFTSGFHIQGFAKPKLIYGEKSDLSLFKKLVAKLQVKSLKTCDLLWCESEDVKRQLLSILGMNSIVVSNALHQDFLQSRTIAQFSVVGKNELKLGYVGANYPHKNFNILLKVMDCIRQTGVQVSLTTTLNDSDFDSDIGLLGVHNLGKQNREGLMKLYNSVDLVVLPSTLECFSVTPLEAIYFGKSCIVGDFSFNRSVYNSWVDYANVLDAKSLAETILYRYRNPRNEYELRRIADEMLSTYPVETRNKKLINLIFNESNNTEPK